MMHQTCFIDSQQIKFSYSLFAEGSQAAEVHALLEPMDHSKSAQAQIEALEHASARFFSDRLQGTTAMVWKRYFLTDAANQEAFIPHRGDAALSIVQQPPLSGCKVALWVYGIQNASIQKASAGAVSIHRPRYTHLFHTGLHCNEVGAYKQTQAVFKHYVNSLQGFGARLAEHCIRTWLFVHNVDTHYAGLVAGRKVVFDREALTSDTHYIASTGIEGRTARPGCTILMDAYAVPEITAEQLTF